MLEAINPVWKLLVKRGPGRREQIEAVLNYVSAESE